MSNKDLVREIFNRVGNSWNGDFVAINDDSIKDYAVNRYYANNHELLKEAMPYCCHGAESRLLFELYNDPAQFAAIYAVLADKHDHEDGFCSEAIYSDQEAEHLSALLRVDGICFANAFSEILYRSAETAISDICDELFPVLLEEDKRSFIESLEDVA